MLRFTSFLLALSLALPALACTDGRGFLPDNDLSYPVSDKSTGLSELQFHAVINKVMRVYRPIAKSYGGTLIINRRWLSDVVNAGTYRDSKNSSYWVLNLYGGFARHPHITEDGFALVICHELGHHIGGAPKKVYQSGSIWASTEGQSDYFATLKCLRKVFAADDNLAVISGMDVPSQVRADCSKAFTTDWEAAICMRTSMAGFSVAKVNADSRQVPLPDFSTPDPSQVDFTSNAHPVPQCRLDTYLQGSICEVPSTEVLSQTDETKATCHPVNKSHSGLRPHCWFKPKI